MTPELENDECDCAACQAIYARHYARGAEKAEADRDTARAWAVQWENAWRECRRRERTERFRAEKAEAEVARLRKVLEYYAQDNKLGDVARRALATTSASNGGEE